jgi:tetratricopeptide (TPR) repeat protein/TolB-like protein
MTVLALGLLLALNASSAPGAVLVLPPEGALTTEESAWVAEAVSDLLPRSLAAAGVPAIARADRLRAQEALEIPALVPLTRATSIRVGEALGATQIVTGSYRVDGKTVTLSLRLLDTERGTLSSPFVGTGPLETVSDLVHGLAWDLALASSPLPSLTRQEFLARRTPVPFEALRVYGGGLIARDSSHKKKRLSLAVRLAPQEPGFRLTLGRFLLESGEPTAAYDTLARIPPDARDARTAGFLQGLALLAVGRYREAADVYARLAAEDPTPAVLTNHALALLRGGSKDVKASQILQKALELDPDSTDAAFNLAWALFYEGDAAGAVPHLRTVIKEEPLDGHARLILAWVLSRAGKTAEAQEEWKGVVAMAPSYAGLTNPDLTRRFERAAGAERRLVVQRAARTKAEVVAGLLGRVERLTASGDTATALQELVRAAYLDPHSARVHLLLARTHRARGEHEQALNEFRMCLWSAEDPAVRAEMAVLLKDIGRLTEARSEAQKVLKLDPQNAVARKLIEG